MMESAALTRLDHDCYGIGAVYDFAGIVVVLRRLSAKQKRIERANAMLCDRLPYVHSLDGGWLLPSVW